MNYISTMKAKTPLAFNRKFLFVTGFYASNSLDQRIPSFVINVAFFFSLMCLGICPGLYYILTHLNEVEKSVGCGLTMLGAIPSMASLISFASQKSKVFSVFGRLETTLNQGTH